ncbi:MAG: hypothetical protein WAM14_10620 [Candidatus Nitrosopolaris sp.]
MSSNKDILTKEIESWGDFEYALREENRILFDKMLSKCRKREYIDCVNAKDENFAEALFLILIFEQQRMRCGSAVASGTRWMYFKGRAFLRLGEGFHPPKKQSDNDIA